MKFDIYYNWDFASDTVEHIGEVEQKDWILAQIKKSLVDIMNSNGTLRLDFFKKG